MQNAECRLANSECGTSTPEGLSSFFIHHSSFIILHSSFSIRPLLVLMPLLSLLSGCLPQGLLITPVSMNQDLMEEELFRESVFAADKIAVVDVDGLIINAKRPHLIGQGEHPVSLLLEQLDKARRDRRVKAVILRINSPGGGVTASHLMHDEITHFKKSGKPVIAVMMDLAASGGYFIACACDEIVAQPTTVTGGIGVIMQTFDAAGTMKMIGLNADAITSGTHKDSGSLFRALRPEEREWFQAMVNDMYERFVKVVVAGRPNLDEARIRELADGRVFMAGQALEVGLIDRIATLRETIELAKKRAGVDTVRVVTYGRRFDHVPNYYSRTPTPTPLQINMLNVEIPSSLINPTPKFLYLWAPGT